MKKSISIILLAVAVIFGNLTLEAAPKKTTSRSKSSSSALPVVKGEVNQYGDYLTTQMFTIKKGKECGLEIEYPIAGNPALVNSMRSYIRDRVNPDFKGSLENPEEMMRNIMKQVRDVKYGGDGESLYDEVKVVYSTPSVITLRGRGNSYAGGIHGIYWDSGATFLVEDGYILDENDFPSIYSMRSELLNGIAEANDITLSEARNKLFNADEIVYPATILITEKGIELIYQPYEIADFATGFVNGILKPTQKLVDGMSSKGKKFFQGTDNGKQSSSKKDEVVLKESEVMPQFPGGEDALMKWLSDHVVYPLDAYKRGVQGRVNVFFVVEKDGSITNVEVKDPADPELEEEAIRVIKRMPKWQPGKNNGQPVRSLMSIPVNFKITTN